MSFRPHYSKLTTQDSLLKTHQFAGGDNAHEIARMDSLLCRPDEMADNRALLLDKLPDALIREVEQRHERVAAERLGLRRALYLDVPAVACFDHVHVHVGARIMLVRQVEQRL